MNANQNSVATQNSTVEDAGKAGLGDAAFLQLSSTELPETSDAHPDRECREGPKPRSRKTKSKSKKIKASNFPTSDAGNAELFAALYGDMLRYDHQRRRWLMWREHWWVPDYTKEVRTLAKESARYRATSLGDVIKDDKLFELQIGWAEESESRRAIEATIELAKSEQPLADAGQDWDSNPWLLGVANGVIYLRTTKVRPGRPEDKVTMHTSVTFDPSAKCPRWERFLEEVFESDQALIDFVQRAIGYCLTGSVKEQALFLCYGEGSNGKSTFLEVLRFVFGDYAGSVPFSMFDASAKNAIPCDLASTKGKRLVTASETSESGKLNEGRVKLLTGGDRVSARFIRTNWMEFDNTAKFWLAFNHRPMVADDSHGFWRRPKLIPFRHQFGKDEKDPDLKEKLQAEAPGILQWAVKGVLKWLRSDGLGTPPAVEEATAAYRKESDPVEAFITDCCVVQADALVPVARLWNEYESWASANRQFAKLSRPSFCDRLEKRGFSQKQVGKDRTRSWRGLALLNDPAEEGGGEHPNT